MIKEIINIYSNIMTSKTIQEYSSENYTNDNYTSKEYSYNKYSSDDYRDIFYLYVYYSIKDYNDNLSVEMLNSDTDNKLLDIADDLKSNYKLYKHIESYFEIKENIDKIKKYLIDEKNKIEEKDINYHKDIYKYYKNTIHTNDEINNMIDTIAEWEEILCYFVCNNCSRKHLMFANICDEDSDEEANESFDEDSDEEFDDEEIDDEEIEREYENL